MKIREMIGADDGICPAGVLQALSSALTIGQPKKLVDFVSDQMAELFEFESTTGNVNKDKFFPLLAVVVQIADTVPPSMRQQLSEIGTRIEFVSSYKEFKKRKKESK